MPSTQRSNLGLYFLLTYLAFWLLLGATGAVMALKPPSWVVTLMQNVCAWSPTFVVVILFGRLYPGTSIRTFLRGHFLARFNGFVVVLLFVLQAGIVLLGAGLHSLFTNGSFAGLKFAAASALPSLFLVNATSGPMGEELGWRGFALNRLQQRFTPFASALIVGVVWGFWHTPLWVLSGFSGARLLLYVVFFMIGILSLSVVMTVFYNRNRNILVPMVIHFLFNFVLQLFVIDVVVMLTYASLGYLILAIVLAAIDREVFFRRPRTGGGEKIASAVTTS